MIDDTAPITKEEMMGLFGEVIPMEAVSLLWESDGSKTVGQLRSELRKIAAAKDRRTPDLPRHPGFWTYDDSFGQISYYFAPECRAKPPYGIQREVKAIIDIANDGTLAGVELTWGDLPPAPQARD